MKWYLFGAIGLLAYFAVLDLIQPRTVIAPDPGDSQAHVTFFAGSGRLPFSPAVRAGDYIFLSGQIGVDGPDDHSDVKTQTRKTLDRLKATLESGGASMDDIVKCTVMLEDMSEWAAVNEVYVTYFKPGRMPARSAFGSDGLAFGAKLELECIAYVPGER